MFTRRTVFSAVVAAALLAAGCGGSGNGGSSGPAAGADQTSSTPTERAEPSAERETIKTARDSRLGTYLVDEEGKAVYLFEKDTGTESTCYNACAQVWPPVVTSGKPEAEGGAKSSKLSTTMRKDGTAQVLYGGHPLYYYAPDKPGTTKGQGLDQFGAEWYVLTPAGDKLEKGESGDDDS